MKYISKPVRVAILTGSIWAAAASTSQAVILLQQNFDTDPVNYTASPFVQQGTGLDATSKYWDLSNNIPTTIRNPNILGNTTNYLTGQNMDAPLPFSNDGARPGGFYGECRNEHWSDSLDRPRRSAFG
jgi:hypothetical protein